MPPAPGLYLSPKGQSNAARGIECSNRQNALACNATAGAVDVIRARGSTIRNYLLLPNSLGVSHETTRFLPCALAWYSCAHLSSPMPFLSSQPIKTHNLRWHALYFQDGSLEMSRNKFRDKPIDLDRAAAECRRGWRAPTTRAVEANRPHKFARTHSRARAITASLVALAMACGGPASSRKRASAAKAGAVGSVVRYRLLLRDNPVDPGEAFRCYGRCQDAVDPKAYLACLSECPGFEETHGATCAKYEVPPETACLTARQIPASSEVPPGLVVLAVIGTFMVVVGASSLCALSSSQCGGFATPRYPPPQ